MPESPPAQRQGLPDPGTLTSDDSTAFTKSGRHTRAVQPVDMFPKTSQTEVAEHGLYGWKEGLREPRNPQAYLRYE